VLILSASLSNRFSSGLRWNRRYMSMRTVHLSVQSETNNRALCRSEHDFREPCFSWFWNLRGSWQGRWRWPPFMWRKSYALVPDSSRGKTWAQTQKHWLLEIMPGISEIEKDVLRTALENVPDVEWFYQGMTVNVNLGRWYAAKNISPQCAMTVHRQPCNI